MKFWQVLAMTDMAQIPTLARKAEELGFEGITLGDHLVTFARQTQAYDYSDDEQVLWDPDTHWPDPWVQIAALAQITERLQFITHVYVLPLRDPFSIAKQISTAANIAPGRITLGMGIGWQQAEFELVGQDYRHRGRRTDEMLTVMQRLMSGEMVEYHGEFYDFEPLQMAPGVPEPVPITVGGYSPAAFARAARFDGWSGAQNRVEDLPGVVAAVNAEREKAGTLDRPFEFSVSLYDEITEERVRAAEDAGITRINKDAWLGEDGRVSTMTLDEKLADMEAFAARFIK